MRKDLEKIAAFYDAYSERQQKVAYNERHYFLLKKVKEYGLTSTSSVLDIGCGIGITASLIAKKVKHGKIMGIDISPRSIELAREQNIAENIVFEVGCISSFSSSNQQTFDFILLFDVLEHIPLDLHEDVFRVISSLTNDWTQVLINVPNPPAHEHSIANFPEAQQAVEEVIHMHHLLSHLEKNGLFIYEMFTYDLWQNDEYQFYRIMKKKPYNFKEIQLKTSRLEHLKRKFFI